MQNPILTALEQHTELGPVDCSRLMCIAYATYAHYKSGHRVLPPYHEAHVQALIEMPRDQLNRYVKERVNDDTPSQ